MATILMRTMLLPSNTLSFSKSRLSILKPSLANPFLSRTSCRSFVLINCPAPTIGKDLPLCQSPVVALSTFVHDAVATAAIMAGGYALVSTFDNLTKRNVVEQNLSRKIVHILSGLLFLASWPIFSTSAEARYFASVVPFVNLVRLAVNGLSLVQDKGLIKSVTREGNPKELLKGPLYYVLILILCATVFWRESPVGVVSLAMMCGGDGVADIMGRRFGSSKIPYNKSKSWAGSISMFVVGFLISIGMLYYFSALGYFDLDWISTTKRVALVSLVATAVESLPTTGLVDDNISVPLVSMLTAYLILG